MVAAPTLYLAVIEFDNELGTTNASVLSAMRSKEFQSFLV